MEANILEKEIEEIIDREKTKSSIVSKLLSQNIPPTVKTNNWKMTEKDYNE